MSGNGSRTSGGDAPVIRRPMADIYFYTKLSPHKTGDILQEKSVWEKSKYSHSFVS